VHQLIGETVYDNIEFDVIGSPISSTVARKYTNRRNFVYVDKTEALLNYSSILSTLFNVDLRYVSQKFLDTSVLSFNVQQVLVNTLSTQYNKYSKTALSSFAQYLLSTYNYKIIVLDTSNNVIDSLHNNRYTTAQQYDVVYEMSAVGSYTIQIKFF
jgi:hypothetical protein